MRTTLILSTLLLSLFSSAVVKANSITGRVEVAIVFADSIDSWLNEGTGLIRGEDNTIQWQQGFIAGKYDISNDWQANVVANAYADGDKHLGFTQAYLQYKPLSPNQIKFSSKLGMFYPAMSVENTSEGWLSPYTYTQSAINSWIGEELRTIGGELSWSSNGRARRSPWSWQAHIGIHKANDTTGTLLTWRGFAMHDRQTLHHEKIPVVSIEPVLSLFADGAPLYTKPFAEIDGDLGAYVGVHLSYLRKTDVSYYFYDNRADENRINTEVLYGWRTKFHSLAVQHQLDSHWRLMAQFLEGSTLMGNRAVYGEFVSAYIAASYATGKHRNTLRIDYHEVEEDDMKPLDQNNSNGVGITAAWRFNYTNAIEVGAEFHQHRNEVASRQREFVNEKQLQTQLRLVLAYIF